MKECGKLYKAMWQVVLMLLAIATIVSIFATREENAEREYEEKLSQIQTENNSLKTDIELLSSEIENINNLLGITEGEAVCWQTNYCSILYKYNESISTTDNIWWTHLCKVYGVKEEALVEHTYATQLYIALRVAGYSKEVTCGIMGNIMIECSYGTLDIHPDWGGYYKGTYYYGLCMWSTKYHPDISDASFQEQVCYLIESTKEVFTKYGCYNTLCECKTVKKAAEMFAMVYERPGNIDYSSRVNAGNIAYAYYCS